MFLRRLQLSVRNVHIKIQDPVTGRCFGLRLAQMHTCLPGETEHSSILLADDAGVLAHSSAAARGSIQKQVAVDGIEFYWKAGEGNSGPAKESTEQEDSLREPEDVEEEETTRHFWSEDELEEEKLFKDWRILHPTGIVVHMSSKILGSGGSDPVKIHAASVIHSLPVAIRPCQVADIVQCADQLQWTAVRAKYAHLRPAEMIITTETSVVVQEPRGAPEGGAQEDLGREQKDWRSMWRYAVNAVLADVRGPLKAAEWQPPEQVQQSRRQYVLLYRKKLEAEREQERRDTTITMMAPTTAANVPSLTAHPLADHCPPELGNNASTNRPPLVESSQSPTQQQQPQQQSSYESSAQPSSQPSQPQLPGRSLAQGLSPIGERRLEELERQLCVADILTCRAAARHIIEGVPESITTTASVPSSASTVALSSDSSVRGGGGAARKGLFWGVARIATIVGYLPTLGGGSTKALLPRPTESDVRELCEVVDFHPEYDEVTSSIGQSGERPSSASSTVSAGGPAAPLFELSLNCLLTRTSVTLKHDDGDTLAVIEFHGLQSEVRIENDGLSAGVTLTALTGHAYTPSKVSTSSSSSLSTPLNSRKQNSLPSRELFEKIEIGLLGRGPDEASDPSNSLSPGAARAAAPPVLRLQYIANASRLDVLVQPLRAHLTPGLMQSLAAFVPPPVEGSFGGACMAAVNGLNPESRAAIKAEKLKKIGLPIDLVAKFINFELLVTRKGTASKGILLRTGSVLLHSVGQVAAFTASESVFKVLESLRDVAGQRPAGEILSAAVTEIEQRLVYQHFELSVGGLELGTVDSEVSASFLPGYDNLVPIDGLQLTTVLHPTPLSGGLKIHRLVEDSGAPQVQCAIKIDPIVTVVTLPTVQLIAKTLDLAALASAPVSAPSVVAAAPRIGLKPLGPLQAVVDLSLASVDIRFDAEGIFKGRLSLAEGNLALKAHKYGAAVDLSLSEFDVIDISPEDPRAISTEFSFIPRLAKRFSVKKLAVVVAPAVKAGDTTEVDVQIEDLKLEGFASEPACFVTR